MVTLQMTLSDQITPNHLHFAFWVFLHLSVGRLKQEATATVSLGPWDDKLTHWCV